LSFIKLRAGCGVEIFKWFSLISITGMKGLLDRLFKNIGLDEKTF